MPFPAPIPESISAAEAEALARYVHDLEGRMEQLHELLQARGTPSAAVLAGAIVRDLRALESELTVPERSPSYGAPLSIVASRGGSCR